MLKVSGRKEARQSLKDLPNHIAMTTEKGLKENLDLLVERAKLNAPVDKGDLRESIHAEVKRSGTKITGEISCDVPYALKVHEEEHSLGVKSAQQPTTEEGGVGSKFIYRVIQYNGPAIDKKLGNAQLDMLKKLARDAK